MSKINNVHWADSELQEQILEQIPTTVMAVDQDLKVTYLNTAGCATLGKTKEECAGKHCFDLLKSSICHTDECIMRKAMKADTTYITRSDTEINDRTIPVESYAVPLKDQDGNVIGGLEYVLDISKRVQYEKKLKEQSQTIQKISTPTLVLWEGVLVLPVIGVVDSLRAQYMMDTMLEKIMETSSKVIILDIQGVPAVDTAVANHLIKITKATKLMGCQCIISGISPAVAQAIVQLGIDMSDIKTNFSLKDSLQDAFAILCLEVKKVGMG
jgi:rsbT co-antagonist protein RsbR